MNNKLTIPVNIADHSWGPEKAAIVLVWYGDFQCRLSGQALQELELIHHALGADLRIVFRHFPMTERHDNGIAPAMLAEAVAQQLDFYAIYKLIFQNQDRLDSVSLLKYAGNLNTDPARLREDCQKKQLISRIIADRAGGIASGVTSAPSFFVNGCAYSGDWRHQSFIPYLLTLLRSSCESMFTTELNQFTNSIIL